VLNLFVSELFRVITNHHHSFLRGLHLSCRLGRHLKGSVARGDRAHDGLSILEADVQRLIRLEFLNGGPLHRDLAGKFGFDHESLVVRFFDGASETVAIFQDNLVTK